MVREQREFGSTAIGVADDVPSQHLLGPGIADMLFGLTDPSGRAPYTFAANTHDLATYDNFPCRTTAQGSKVIDYKEGLFSGYKWHDGIKGPRALYREWEAGSGEPGCCSVC